MKQGRDLRRYARSTERRLVLGVLALFFVLGDGLVFIFYGREAGILALICTALGLGPVGLIAFSLWVLEMLSRRSGNG
jgi:hypothetical protein